jgi:hypothetical protein
MNRKIINIIIRHYKNVLRTKKSLDKSIAKAQAKTNKKITVLKTSYDTLEQNIVKLKQTINIIKIDNNKLIEMKKLVLINKEKLPFGLDESINDNSHTITSLTKQINDYENEKANIKRKILAQDYRKSINRELLLNHASARQLYTKSIAGYGAQFNFNQIKDENHLTAKLNNLHYSTPNSIKEHSTSKINQLNQKSLNQGRQRKKSRHKQPGLPQQIINLKTALDQCICTKLKQSGAALYDFVVKEKKLGVYDSRVKQGQVAQMLSSATAVLIEPTIKRHQDNLIRNIAFANKTQKVSNLPKIFFVILSASLLITSAAILVASAGLSAAFTVGLLTITTMMAKAAFASCTGVGLIALGGIPIASMRQHQLPKLLTGVLEKGKNTCRSRLFQTQHSNNKNVGNIHQIFADKNVKPTLYNVQQ